MSNTTKGSDGEMATDAYPVATGSVPSRSSTPEVFISYASADKVVADSICTALERAGVACWIAPRDVTPGNVYSEAIVHAIDAVKVVVLVLSQNAAVSPHVLREVERASSKRHPLVSFRIDLAPVPAALEYFLNTSQWLDASATGVERALPRLVDAVQRCIAHESSPATDQPTGAAQPAVRTDPSLSVAAKTSQRRRPMLVALLAIIAVALAYLVVDQFWLSKHVMDEKPLESAVSTSSVSRPAKPAISDKSIAVLPLVNMSGDPNQEYFVAGMYEALITDLSKISALRVISRTSASVYQGTRKTLPEIGRELAVAHVIEGSVFRVKDQVRITVQLINAATDQHIWAESYDRNIADVLTLQRELAGVIAKQVAATITPDEAQRLARARPVDPATYEAYLRGMFHLNQFTEEGIAKGLAYLKEAVARNPADPLAYAGLALGYIDIGHGTGPHESFPLAKAAVLKALELDPDLAEAHAALAEIRLYYDWDWPAAEESFKRALQLNPSLDFSHAHYSWLLQLTGRVDEGFVQLKEAQRLSPLNPAYNAWLAWQYLDAERDQEGLAEARKSLELNPDFPWGLLVLGYAQAAQGQFEAAIASQQRAIAVMPELKWGLGQAYASAGRRDEALKIASQLAKNPGSKDLMMLGSIYALLGEKDEAMKWIQAAYEARVDWFPWIANRSFAASMRGDPRFEEIVGRLKIPKPIAP